MIQSINRHKSQRKLNSPYKPTALSNFGKFGVPRPVTGSQPAEAGNPFVPQPGLSPVVTSLRADAPVEYRKGLRKPKGDFPAATRRSLRRAMTLAKTGLEQLVPSTVPDSPSTMISRSTPWAETSGKARPDALNKPWLVEPSWFCQATI